MKLCNQDTCISKTFIARNFKLGQLMVGLTGDTLKNKLLIFFRVIARCKFGH